MSALEPPPPQSRAWQAFVGDRLAISGLVILVLVTVCAVLGKLTTEWLVVFDPATVRLSDKFLPPLAAPDSATAPELRPPLGLYLLGTDELGRDVFARMLQGSFVSLTIGFVAVGISLVIGVALGGVVGPGAFPVEVVPELGLEFFHGPALGLVGAQEHRTLGESAEVGRPIALGGGQVPGVQHGFDLGDGFGDAIGGGHGGGGACGLALGKFCHVARLGGFGQGLLTDLRGTGFSLGEAV